MSATAYPLTRSDRQDRLGESAYHVHTDPRPGQGFFTRDTETTRLSG